MERIKKTLTRYIKSLDFLPALLVCFVLLNVTRTIQGREWILIGLTSVWWVIISVTAVMSAVKQPKDEWVSWVAWLIKSGRLDRFPE